MHRVDVGFTTAIERLRRLLTIELDMLIVEVFLYVSKIRSGHSL